MQIRGLSLTQPWASLCAFEEKKIETRGWRTPYTGWVAIHAAKNFPQWAKELCGTSLFYDTLYKHYSCKPCRMWKMLPTGVIVAFCHLTAVHRIPKTPMHFPRGVPDNHPLTSYPVVLPPFQDNQERVFGDYTPGRFAWIFTDVIRPPQPIPWRGAQGLWKLNVNDAAAHELGLI